MKFFTSLAPVFFKELLPYIPLRSYQLVSMDKLLPEAFSLVKNHTLNKSPKFSEKFKKKLPVTVGRFNNLFSTEVSTEFLTDPLHRQKVGEQILEHYFYEIFSSEVWSMDLTPTRWSVDSDGQLFWDETDMRKIFDSVFRAGIQNLYRGFYEESDDRFNDGMNIFLLKNDHAKVKEVFLKHFSEAKSKPVQFKVENLKTSFESIFKVLIDAESKVQSDFAFFGIRLVSLYLTLEKLDVPLNVFSAYQNSLKRL